MAEPAVRSLLIEIEHGVQVVSCASRVISAPAKTAFYISDKTEEIRSHNCINMVADVRELVSIGSMGMDFLVTIFVSLTKKTGGGGFVLAGANDSGPRCTGSNAHMHPLSRPPPIYRPPWLRYLV
jgi:hypothetical protein